MVQQCNTTIKYTLYSKKVPEKDAAQKFVDRIRQVIPASEIIEKSLQYMQKSRYSPQDWINDTDNILSHIERNVK